MIAYSFIGFESQRYNYTKIQKAVFRKKDKVLYQPIKSRDCMLQNADIAKILLYQQDRKKVEIYSDSQSCLKVRVEYF